MQEIKLQLLDIKQLLSNYCNCEIDDHNYLFILHTKAKMGFFLIILKTFFFCGHSGKMQWLFENVGQQSDHIKIPVIGIGELDRVKRNCDNRIEIQRQNLNHYTTSV